MSGAKVWYLSGSRGDADVFRIYEIVPRHVLLPAFGAGAPHRLRPSRGSRRVPYCTSAGCPFCWCHKSARHRWHISGPDYDPHEQKVLQRYKPVGRTGIRARTAQTILRCIFGSSQDGNNKKLPFVHSGSFLHQISMIISSRRVGYLFNTSPLSLRTTTVSECRTPPQSGS